MKKRIFAALLALTVVAMAATATGITYQEFTWNDITFPIIAIETPESVGDWLYPADGYYFISVSMQLTPEMVADDEQMKALDDATFLVLADGTEFDNSIRSTTAETGDVRLHLRRSPGICAGGLRIYHQGCRSGGDRSSRAHGRAGSDGAP